MEMDFVLDNVVFGGTADLVLFCIIVVVLWEIVYTGHVFVVFIEKWLIRISLFHNGM